MILYIDPASTVRQAASSLMHHLVLPSHPASAGKDEAGAPIYFWDDSSERADRRTAEGRPGRVPEGVSGPGHN